MLGICSLPGTSSAHSGSGSGSVITGNEVSVHYTCITPQRVQPASTSIAPNCLLASPKLHTLGRIRSTRPGSTRPARAAAPFWALVRATRATNRRKLNPSRTRPSSSSSKEEYHLNLYGYSVFFLPFLHLTFWSRALLRIERRASSRDSRSASSQSCSPLPTLQVTRPSRSRHFRPRQLSVSCSPHTNSLPSFTVHLSANSLLYYKGTPLLDPLCCEPTLALPRTATHLSPDSEPPEP